jgi:hypothetical protein
MDKDDPSSGGLPGGGLILVALLAAGALFISHAPLETRRPSLSDTHLERHEAVQNIDAGLWQDPYSAVANARVQSSRFPGCVREDRERPGEKRFADELKRQALAGGESSGGVVVLVVLVVLVSGGPYAEPVESRRRMR